MFLGRMVVLGGDLLFLLFLRKDHSRYPTQAEQEETRKTADHGGRHFWREYVGIEPTLELIRP